MLLAILVVIVTAAALKVASSVLLPVVFAGFLIAVTWPLYSRLVRRLPRGVSALLTLIAFLICVGVVGAGLWYNAQLFSERSHEYVAELRRMGSNLAAWSERRGLGSISPDSLTSAAPGLLRSVGASAGSFVAAFVLMVAFLVLGILDVHAYRGRLRRGLPMPSAERWQTLIRRVARDFQRYVIVRTAIGLLTGACVAIGAFIVGLDFPLVWGMLNFLLNFVPTLGSILGVIPPTLFALVQFEGYHMALVVLAVVGGIQLVMGNYVDPLVQGKYMALSPAVVLFSVTLWGFIWGPAGALIGVPLTVLTVLVCREFDSTRWIAALLAGEAATPRSDQPSEGESTADEPGADEPSSAASEEPGTRIPASRESRAPAGE